MAIGLADAKMLWGRAGGRCSNPECRADLTRTKENHLVLIGEMAHLIAQSADGPRGTAGGGPDTYGNLVLLCPNCHTTIDKAPELYPAEVLKAWKLGREREVEQAGQEELFQSFSDLKRQVATLLAQNRAIFDSVGPRSRIAEIDPGSDAFDLWVARKLDTILPNNVRIVNMLDANVGLLPDEAIDLAGAFKEHALAFSDQQYQRREFYPLFPHDFGRYFSYG